METNIVNIEKCLSMVLICIKQQLSKFEAKSITNKVKQN